LPRGSTSFSTPAKRRRHPAWGKILAAAAVLVVLGVLWRFTPVSEFITAERIVAWARSVRETKWAPLVLVLAYTPAAFLMFPRPLLTLVGVIAFGPWLGMAYATAGILTAALATYYAGRIFSRETVHRFAGAKFERASKVLQRHGVLSIFAANMTPVPPFVVQGIVAGAIRINVWHYTIGSVLGLLPGVLLSGIFGHQLAALLEDPSQISLWLVAAAVLVFAAGLYATRRWLSRLE